MKATGRWLEQIWAQERIRREVPREPTHREGDEEGPRRPATRPRDPSELLRRMRRVDPEQARRYRQRSGQ